MDPIATMLGENAEYGVNVLLPTRVDVIMEEDSVKQDFSTTAMKCVMGNGNLRRMDGKDGGY